MAKAASTWDFESDDKFKLKAMEHEHDFHCDEWNAECTLKLKEVVAAARKQFKWQTSAADATLKDKPCAQWLAPRPLALKPLYWEINSDACTSVKKWYEGEHTEICWYEGEHTEICGVRRYGD